MREVHETPFAPEQVKALKDINLRVRATVADHCDACSCKGCREAKDTVVDLRLIATIELLGMKL
jgi:hypothetical protein